MTGPSGLSTSDPSAATRLVDAIANRLHDLATDGAGLEETIAALLHHPNVSLDILAAAHLDCMRRSSEDPVWERAATMVASAMGTGLFQLEH